MACRKIEARGHLLHKTGTPPKHFSRECKERVVNSRLKNDPYSFELNYSFSQVQKELGGFTVLWTIFAAFFGIVVTDPNNSKSKSGKFLLMIFLFCGRGFFFAYLAFLTSSLAFPNEFLAFTSPQEILNTNYR